MSPFVLVLGLACTPGGRGSSDSGSSDSGSSDSGASDSGASDSGASDSGASDSGASDSGSSDTGSTAAGVDALIAALDADRLLDHLDAFQAAADAHGGARAVGDIGHGDSVDHVVAELEAAGFVVRRHHFVMDAWDEIGAPFVELSAATVDPASLGSLSYGGSGEAVDAPVVPVDVQFPPGEPDAGTSGCEVSDFAAFPGGAIALLQRGGCSYGTKAENAQAAGAAAVILVNEGQPGRQERLRGTLGADSDVRIPVIGAPSALGEALVAAGGGTGTVRTETMRRSTPTWNITADLAGDPERIVVVGAHLDSARGSPGINDNGSGAAVLLELALQAAELPDSPANTLRFAWWTAREAGAIGARRYLDAQSPAGLARHVGYLDLDMLGSPNGGRFVLDGTVPVWDELPPAPEGSDWLAGRLGAHLDGEGLSWQAAAFDPTGDHVPFLEAGVPVGGLTAGGERLRADGDPSDWGGTAGLACDACQRLPCDDRGNVDAARLLELARAAAAATWAAAQAGPGVLEGPGPVPDDGAADGR